MRITLARPRWTWLGRWVGVPFVLGLVLGALLDPSSPPGTERLTAVFLVDGESYFGHLVDVPWSDTVTLSDVYYFQTTNPNPGPGESAQVVLVKRGTEPHDPADGMRIRRDKILAVERMRLDSQVARAIAVDRSIARTAAGR